MTDQYIKDVKRPHIVRIAKYRQIRLFSYIHVPNVSVVIVGNKIHIVIIAC